MSVQATTAVWRYSESEGNERLVLLAFADHAHPDGTNAKPGTGTLMDMCKLSERAVRDNISRLRDRGELVRDKTGRGPGNYAEYSIALPGLKAAESAGSPEDEKRQNGVNKPAAQRTKTGSSTSAYKDEPKEPNEPSSAGAPNAGTALNKGIPAGFKLPSSTKARLGKEARALFADGFTEMEIVAGIKLFCEKGGQLAPTTLPSLVMEAKNGPPRRAQAPQRKPDRHPGDEPPEYPAL